MRTPKFAHVVYYTTQKEAMTQWYEAVLDGHVIFTDDDLTFITYDDEHHRVALIHPPGAKSQRRSEDTAAMHHSAYTFETLDDLLERYAMLRDKGITPAVCINHGITTSMYYMDPDGSFVELQVDCFAEPDDATAYMNGPDYDEDSVGPQFDPEKMLADRKAGVSDDVLTARPWAKEQGMDDPMKILMGPRFAD